MFSPGGYRRDFFFSHLSSTAPGILSLQAIPLGSQYLKISRFEEIFVAHQFPANSSFNKFSAPASTFNYPEI
jgi:hypothetical protein